MARQQNQDRLEIGFRSIQLLKSQTLGIGSYGKVCKAKCDDLICAAKIIHETLFDPTVQRQIARHREHRLPFLRFQQECEFMSVISHPNIVQYLGMHQDPETGLPVLLMELMDDSLTHFLESSQDPVPYTIQVNFCHDIVLAISYLHSNGIIHRDLSSNNVLLRGNVIAKVTDFGMAKLGDANTRATRISLTMVPGTDAYMPPEAVKEQPVYTAKIDCFAIGILIIQILTRQFPDPTDRLKTVYTTDPQFPSGRGEVRVSEIERRQNHISQIDPNHPLLPIALHCLKDSDVKRPSAQELCRRVATLKETSQYIESVKSSQERRPEENNTTEKEEQIRELQQQIQYKDHIIQENEQTIIAKQQENYQLRQQLDEKIREKEERERQLQRVIQQLESHHSAMAQVQTQTTQLKQKRSPTMPQPSLRVLPQTHPFDTSSKAPETRERFRLKWRNGEKPPSWMNRRSNAVVNGDIMYLIPDEHHAIYTYDSTDEAWNQLPDCPTRDCSLAVIDHLLTTIGGIKGGKVINQLFSFTEKGSSRQWNEVFPRMPTKRGFSITVCSGQALIVAGGNDKNQIKLRTVEVMDITTRQWATAANLPEPLCSTSATICEGRIFILGFYDANGRGKNTVYTCSLDDLLQSRQSRSVRERLAKSLSLTGQAGSTVWNKVADLPVIVSTCVTLHDRLLAIGGCDSKIQVTADIYIYDTTSNQWEIISKMTVARYQCFAAVLPNSQLMVVGGWTGSGKTDSVEIATIM